MAMEIQLINQIEKFEFLYNYSLPEYNRKDLVEEAWATIAASTNLSISDCKEKWRNIRSSFLRSMKPSGTKVKKPYYLTDYLTFILPFLKPISVDTEENHYESPPVSGATETLVVVDYIKEEPANYIKEEPEEYAEQAVNSEPPDDNCSLGELLNRQSPVARKRRRFIPTVIRKRAVAEYMKNRARVTSSLQKNDTSPNSSVNSSNNSAMKMFLMSLLPELESMSEDQIRMFKIKSMMLIDDIKLNYPQMRENMSTINAERLQKRLINLLLKSLQKRCKEE